ncbi:MAG TPA: 4-hydroxythreonine-4-phosphate dehydrogenase PdxA [Candidatus Sulfopaludibacter sp.]|jgi:4-hydroxythreonine-4-phosphate dehydrogenase|nr:4-hydroxythreonine-4-phosphate dehydrogenase PdxA [Candidatus Sulfopaludibacter sp.]
MTPTIALTMGDPAGVGPEVVLKALADPDLAPLAHWVVVGDSAVLAKTGLPLLNARVHDAHALADLADFRFGKLDARCGAAGVEYVRIATEMCLRGDADAMVTAPLNKEAVTLTGRQFSGHTEYIAELCGATESRMLLASERLSTIHVTTHVALRDACAMTTARVFRTIELGHEAMRLLGFLRPRIAVCGLNPHAGEHGLFGDEDGRVIAPAIAAARAAGIECSGPHAGDTVFLQASRGAYDLVVAMYHDQGHIPMKLLDFEGTVNISLGIPIIRTSVDHGTAFDIAGQNLADPRSMKQAMRMAARMAAASKSLTAPSA